MNSYAVFRWKFEAATKEFNVTSFHQLNKPELSQISKTYQ